MLLDPAHFCFRPSNKQFLSLHHFDPIQFTVPSELKSFLLYFTASTSILKVKVGKIIHRLTCNPVYRIQRELSFSFNGDRKLVEIEGEPIVVFNNACQYVVITDIYSYDLQ